MAKKQTRRAVSFNRELFQLVQAASSRAGVSTSQFVAEAVREKLKQSGEAKLPVQDFARPGPTVTRGDFEIGGRKFKTGMA